MKPKSKSYSVVQAKNIRKLNATSSIINKVKNLNTSKQSFNTKGSERKVTKNDKQNIETGNIPSPQQKIKNKSFKPKVRRNSKLELESTVSLIVNESVTSVKNQDILDSLLYGQIDLTYSQDFQQKDEDNEELLISECEQNIQSINFKNCKSLSPIKSISQYSITQNDSQRFMIQKIQNEKANCTLKVRSKVGSIHQNKIVENYVIARRLMIYFNENNENLLKFYCCIHQVNSKQDLYFKIRQYLFQNGIIFKKCQLNEFIEVLCSTLNSINQGSRKYQFCEDNMELLIESIFLRTKLQNNQLTSKFWLLQHIYEKIFAEKDLVSIWKLIIQLFYEAPQQIETSFRHSRFCLSTDSNNFFHETDEKRKKQNILSILEWLKKFITPESVLETVKPEIQEQNQIKIKISPPQ